MSKNIKEIIAKEYLKCSKDPVHFMKRFCKIQHPKLGKIPFNLYPFQEETLKQISEHDYNVILKSRQLGISTLSAGYALWCMTFKTDFNVLVIATKQDTAKNLVTKVRVMHDGLPSWLKVAPVEDNKLGLRYQNGSQIKAVSAAGDAGRSEALSLLIIDEAAFINGVNEIWTSAQPTLSTGGRAIVLSTPNGTGNFFHKTWKAAIENDEHNKFHPIKLHWSVHPEHDQDWRDKQTALLGEKMAAQECDVSFISSGYTVVDGPIIKWYEDNQVCEPMEKRGPGGDFWVWEPCNYSKDYMVIADVARGDGKDYSAFHVIDIEEVKQVAEYRGQVGTTDYGNMLVNIATEYNDALLVIENANIGWATIQVAIDRGYKNLYYTYKQDGYVDAEVQLGKNYDLVDKSKMVPGFTTSTRTRPLIISKLETYMREKVPIIKSQRLINEIYVFIWNGPKAEAQQGYNDDLTMAFCIGLWVRDTALKLRQQGMDLTRSTLGHLSKTKSVYSSKDAQKKDSGWTQRLPDGTDEDLSQWL